mgnify:CR=1 FL=1
MKVLILIQLLTGFVMAMIGTITMFRFDILTGMLIILVGMYGMIRATNRVNYEWNNTNNTRLFGSWFFSMAAR